MSKETKCKLCQKNFDTNPRRKYYCSKECHSKVRKLNHKSYTRELHRLKSGTYEKWANELRAVGYIVIPSATRKYHVTKEKRI